MLVLFLPLWSPEMNLIELVWNNIVKQIKNVRLIELYNIGESAAVKAFNILDEITQEEVNYLFVGLECKI